MRVKGDRSTLNAHALTTLNINLDSPLISIYLISNTIMVLHILYYSISHIIMMSHVSYY